MKKICQDVKNHVPDVVARWEQLVHEQPWFSLPQDHRVDSLPDVIVGLVEASLCNPVDEAAHRQAVDAAARHGEHRRSQGVPEHLIFTEFHLLRQAIWYYIVHRFGSSQRTTDAIMRIDTALTVATNASLWGYHRPEIAALGRWDEGMRSIAASSPLLRAQAEQRAAPGGGADGPSGHAAGRSVAPPEAPPTARAASGRAQSPVRGVNGPVTTGETG